ncbi:MAG: hypothetical protein GXO19_04255 [Epsilonproteobacteria bacterium]|nr:hypothetical protein [Campylobacterota bacterium]NPA56935.1 hypothetical protein [Campylobacterota bacterium]
MGKLVLLPLLLFSLLCGGEIKINQKSDSLNITPYVHYFIAPQELTEPPSDEGIFIRSFKDNLLLGYLYDKRVWIKFDITNESNESVEKILAFDYPIQKELSLYERNTNSLYLNRHENSLIYYYRLHFKPHETKNLLLEASNRDAATIVKLKLYNPSTFFSINMEQLLLAMLFIGAIGAILIYNLFLLFLTKDMSYFFYILMVSIFTLLILHIDGVLTTFFTGFVMSKRLISTLLLILAISMILFTKTFLNLSSAFPRIDQSLNLILFTLSLLYLVEITWEIIPTSLERIYYSATFAYLLYIGLFAYLHGKREALYYLLGWTLLFTSTTLLVLRQIGVSDLYDRFPYLVYIGVIGEAMLFSMALSARINTMRLEKNRITQELLRRRTLEKRRLEAYANGKTQELQKTLQERAMLLKELHHRVKNNLQIITSLLRLQADKHRNRELGKILIEAENRIRAISNIHEMLYKENSLSKVDLQRYLETLIDGLRTTYSAEQSIDISIHSNATLDMDRAIYCGLIVNELVTNALKYAFREGDKGKITIIFTRQDGNYKLTISDNGRGIDPKGRSHEGLGLKIVKTLATHQLKGKIEIRSHGGLHYTIYFPID